MENSRNPKNHRFEGRFSLIIRGNGRDGRDAFIPTPDTDRLLAACGNGRFSRFPRRLPKAEIPVSTLKT